MADFSKDFQIAYDDARDACTIRFRCFDTPNSVTVFGSGAGLDVEGVLLEVRRICLEFHRLWSFSLHDSDIARVNEPCERVQVDMRTALLISSMKLFHETEPAFDFTVGPVSLAWKHAERVPSAGELEEALSHVGADKVSVEGDVIAKDDPLVRIDVGGAAKGFVADAVAASLRTSGVASADIDLGGNLFMVGDHPEGRPWRVSVRIPDGITASPPIIEVRNQSVVTSGSYERFVEIGGKRYQHIIDVRTGWPSESDIVSATVVCASSLQADMLATTALLAGSDGFEELAARHRGCSFFAITEDAGVLSANIACRQ